MKYLDTRGIADTLDLSVDYVRNVVVHKPDFPLPDIVGGPRKRRWLAADVLAWAKPAPRGRTGQGSATT